MAETTSKSPLANADRASAARAKVSNIKASPLLAESARKEVAEVLQMLRSSEEGLSTASSEERLAEHGPNEVAAEHHNAWPALLLRAVRNPLVILLIALATVSFATGDMRAGTVMLLMVLLGVSLAVCAGKRGRRWPPRS